MKVLLVIPAYNEALNIEKTVKDVTENTLGKFLKYSPMFLSDFHLYCSCCR